MRDKFDNRKMSEQDNIQITEKISKKIMKAGEEFLGKSSDEESIWVGKERNEVIEFLFELVDGTEITKNLDEEDPEEFIIYKRQISEGKESNPR